MDRVRATGLAVALFSMTAICFAGIPQGPPDGSQSNAQTANPSVEALKEQALQEGEAGRGPEAIRDYKRALDAAPDWKEGRWNLGTLQYEAGQFSDASGTFQHVVQFAPELGMAWAFLGLAEYENKDFAGALTHLEKANALTVKDDPEIARVATYHLALLRIQSSEFESASDLLISAFASGVLSPQVKFAIGLATLRIPLLPEQIEPSKEALVLSVGEAVLAGASSADRIADLATRNADVPYLHYALAIALEKAGRNAEAISALHREAAISPFSPLPWVALSRIATKAGDNAVAEQASRKAAALTAATEASVQSEPRREHRPEARVVKLYGNLSAANTASAGKDDSWNEAMRQYSSGSYAEAAVSLKQWLGSNPENGTGWAMLGLCEFATKDYDNARIHLGRGAGLGLSGSPASLFQARYTYGILLVRAGAFDEAAEILQAAAANSADALDSRLQMAMGLALLHRAEFQDAIETQERPLILAAGRIANLLRQSKYDDALPLFRQLLAAWPSTPFLHYAYGTALLALSEFDEAAKQMQAEIAISARSELPRLRLASIALRQHNPQEAMQWSRKALELAPGSANGHYLLGRALLESGDTATAIRELETAVQLSPGSPEIHYNLAKAYLRGGKPEKAEAERATFARLNAVAGTSQTTP